jgi:hypothetical protein
MMSSDALVQTLRHQHRLPTARLLATLGVSRPTLMRAVRAAGPAVLSIGRARRTSYAARRPLRGSMAPLPLFRVDAQARTEQVGALHLAYPTGTVLALDGSWEWPLDADMRDGWFDGLPPTRPAAPGLSGPRLRARACRPAAGERAPAGLA